MLFHHRRFPVSTETLLFFVIFYGIHVWVLPKLTEEILYKLHYWMRVIYMCLLIHIQGFIGCNFTKTHHEGQILYMK